MRILMLSSLLPPEYEGGFEVNALKIALALRARGHDVHVVTSRFTDAYNGNREEPDWVHRIFERAHVWDVYAGVDEPEFDAHSAVGIRRIVGLAKRNLLVLRSLKPIRNAIRIAATNEQILNQWLDTAPAFDIGYANLLHYTGLGCTLALTARGVPLMWHLGDDWLLGYAMPRGKQGRLLQMLERARYTREKSVDLRHVVLVSEFLRAKYVGGGFPESGTSVINRGVEFDLRLDVDRPRTDPPIFLMACRIKAYKGVGVAIEAAGKLHAADPALPWRLEIAGKAEAASVNRYLAQAEGLGIGHRVAFLGQITREDTLKRMASATAFVSASLYGEPFANTIIEAMASGTPLIGSRAGSIEEVVTDGLDGLLYDRFDSSALANHMRWVLDHASEARQMALRAVERIQVGFTMDRVMDITEEYMRRVIDQG